MTIRPLGSDKLRRRCDPAKLGFTSTASLQPLDGLIGQRRAIDALDFGTGLNARGYNIFVLGAAGSGRHNAVKRFLEEKAADRPGADDWVYLHNFAEPHRPRALSLPSGQGPKLAKALDALIDQLKTAMPAVFEGEDYHERRQSIEQEFKTAQEEAFREVNQKAKELGLAVGRAQQGFTIVPLKDGKAMPPEEFQQLPEAEREVIEGNMKTIQGALENAMKSIPQRDKERREKVRNLNSQLAEVAVGRAMEELFEEFNQTADLKPMLGEIHNDLVENASLFVQAAQQEEQGAGEGKPEQPLDRAFNRYKANVVVCQNCQGAPVEYLDFPGLGHLLGRIEHIPHMGAMLTDFTLIKPGVLHRANGGYLMIDAERLLQMPGSWAALKRCLRSNAIAIERPDTGLSTTIAVTLEPEPIPLDVKVVLIGQRQTFFMLQGADPDFSELFKVAADFDELIDWSDATITEFCRLLGSMARRERTRAITAAGCAAIIERAARLGDDNERLTLKVAILADIIREADYWAGKSGAAEVDAEHVLKAIAEQIQRVDRVRERMHEQITRDTVLIDTEGEALGQINGLSVLQIGNFAFGKPTRITARSRMGQGTVLDIEREVELGGSLHTKGVLILSGFLAARYALDAPISLSASLVFEQSYGGVDGDSASSTELYALLSSLSGIPIQQGLAVTGSVNQNGEVQAIGGVNEKIEGFFDICKSRGLTGKQGVLIPIANVKNLMLRQDVVDACGDGQFHIYAVTHIDEGIEILTGTPAGERGADGQFVDGTINRLVEEKLTKFAAMRREFVSGGAGLSV